MNPHKHDKKQKNVRRPEEDPLASIIDNYQSTTKRLRVILKF